MATDTKAKLLDAGLVLLLRHGYNDLGINDLLREAGVPKGSFYHHFKSKEDFALGIIDRYMEEVHQGLDAFVNNPDLAPLNRVRGFFEATEQKYREEGYLGCMLGGVGQELSGMSSVFAERIDQCLGYIADRLSECMEDAVARGDLPAGSDPKALANLLVDCWEGAALRSRLRRNPAPLRAMLDFYFQATPSSIS